MPKQDAVLAVTAGCGDMQAMLRSVWNILLPGLGASAICGDQEELDTLLSSRSLPPAQGEATSTSPLAAQIDGAAYSLNYRGTPFEARFSFCGDTLEIALSTGQARYIVKAGYGRHIDNHLGFWTDGRSYNPPFRFILAPDIAASCAWNENGALIVKCNLTRYAYTETAEIAAAGDGISVRVSMNIQVDEPFALEGKRI